MEAYGLDEACGDEEIPCYEMDMRVGRRKWKHMGSGERGLVREWRVC